MESEMGVVGAETVDSVETVESREGATEGQEGQEEQGGAAVASESGAAESGAAGREDELAKVRELVLKAHPEVVPELVQGSSVDELLASVEPARSAYHRVAEAVRATGAEDPEGTPGRRSEEKGEVAQPPSVPAGGAANVVDPSTLAPTTKIAQGLAQRRR